MNPAGPADRAVPVLAGDLLGRCRFPDPGGGPVDLAVSGGPDSMALIVLARAAGLEGRVHHVDHDLRSGSAAEAEVVATAATGMGFGFVAHRVSIGDGPDLEARARRARYGALPPGVLTGHTMDDQAETVLLNLMRGAALDGLSGMAAGPTPPAGRPAVRRPLLGLRRTETVALCRAAGLDPVADPSNDDPRFRRNRVRTEVLPLLCDVAQRDVVPVLARQAELVAADVELLDTLAAGYDPTDVGRLRAAPEPLARRALRSWLRRAGDAGAEPGAGPPEHSGPREGSGPRDGSGSGENHPPSAAELARVMEVVSGARVACEIAGGRRVSRRAGRLSLQSVVPSGTKAR